MWQKALRNRLQSSILVDANFLDTEDYMFELTKEENLPFVFTEQGVAMLFMR